MIDHIAAAPAVLSSLQPMTMQAAPGTAPLALAPAFDDDFEALLSLRMAAMRESLERVGRFDPQRARERLSRGYLPAYTRHILRRGELVGFVVVQPRENDWLLDHLYIHPNAQGDGVGSWVLAQVLAEVKALVEGLLGRVLSTMTGGTSPAPVGVAVSAAGGAAAPVVTPREVALYYDIGCPYSYLALCQLAGLRARTGAAVRLVPVLLGRLLAGPEGSRPGAAQLRAPWTSEARLRYLKADLLRWARRLGVPLQFPSRYPMNTVTALRLCVQARRRSEAAHELLAQRLMRALWVEDGDLLDERTLRRHLQAVELPGDEFLAGCKLPEVAAALIDSTEQAVGRGVFGTPTFAIEPLGSPVAAPLAADPRAPLSARTPRTAATERVELFFGNDRLDFLEEALGNGRS